MLFLRSLLLFGFLLGGALLHAQDTATTRVPLSKRTPTIAILPFGESNQDAQERGYGKVVASMLGTHLRNETNFVVLERSRLVQVLNEQQYMQSGLTTEDRAKLKQLFSVEVLLTGEASSVGSQIQIDTRLISVNTGEVLVAEYAQVSQAADLRMAISRLAKTIENKYLRQWMGDLQVVTFPVEGEVYLNDQFMGKSNLSKPLRINDILEGQYQLRVLAGGYQKSEQVITIVPRTLREVQVGLKSLPGSLEISSDPLGATVFINSKQMGVTPLKIDTITEGQYTIGMRLKNFKDWAQRIQIQSGQLSEVKTKLEVIPGQLMVHSQPAGARVYVGRNFAGPTPLLLENVPPGSINVELRLDGFAPWSQDVVVQPGERAQVTPELKRQTGKLTLVTSQHGVQAIIRSLSDSSAILNQELPFHKQTLDAGSYQVTLIKARHYTQTKNFTISPDQETRLEADLILKPGKLNFAKLGDAPVDVYIDGEYRGKANNIQVEIPEGQHEILLRNWFGEKKFSIHVGADETLDVSTAELAAGRNVPWWSALAAVLITIPIIFIGGTL